MPAADAQPLAGTNEAPVTNRQSWTQLSSQAFDPIIGSGLTYSLPQADWPDWAKDASAVQRIWLYALKPGEAYPSTATTAPMVLRLLTERLDLKDSEPFNYNWYAIIRSSTGALFHSGPHREVDFGHHLANPVSSSSIWPGT